MEFQKVIDSRFSVRSFDSKPVEDEKIQAILDAARVAPTAKNSQPHKIYVIKSEEALAKARTLTTCHFDAPLIFAICGEEDRACILKSNGKNFMEIDCAIVQTYMMLKATDLGLGSCWVGRINPPEVKAEFNLPKNLVVYGFLVVGYPSPDCEPSPRHFARREISEFAVEL